MMPMWENLSALLAKGTEARKITGDAGDHSLTAQQPDRDAELGLKCHPKTDDEESTVSQLIGQPTLTPAEA